MISCNIIFFYICYIGHSKIVNFILKKEMINVCLKQNFYYLLAKSCSFVQIRTQFYFDLTFFWILFFIVVVKCMFFCWSKVDSFFSW